MNTTNEFSFVLRPSEHGVGVFAAHDIEEGTHLRLFPEKGPAPVERDANAVPECFRAYCIWKGSLLTCPSDFGHMAIGWYLNHSKTPNAYHVEFDYYANRDIKAGDEITIDYNSLEESEDNKADYYRQSNDT